MDIIQFLSSDLTWLLYLIWHHASSLDTFLLVLPRVWPYFLPCCHWIHFLCPLNIGVFQDSMLTVFPSYSLGVISCTLIVFLPSSVYWCSLSAIFLAELQNYILNCMLDITDSTACPYWTELTISLLSFPRSGHPPPVIFPKLLDLADGTAIHAINQTWNLGKSLVPASDIWAENWMMRGQSYDLGEDLW